MNRLTKILFKYSQGKIAHMRMLSSIQELSKFSSRVSELVPRCSNSICQKNMLRHAMPWRQEGFSIADQWFCSPECFEFGAQERITELLASRGKGESSRSPRMPLGLLMLSRGLLTSEQLKQVLAEQKNSSSNTGEVVQKLGFATEEQVTSAVAAQWGCPTFNIEKHTLSDIQIPR